MGIVTSALHGLLHMFQWLQHVIAANWLTIGDGLVLWIPDSHNSVSFNFPRTYRVAPTHLPSDNMALEHLLSFMGNSSTHGVFSNDTFHYQAYMQLSATIGVGGSCCFTKAMQWPWNPTEKIQKKTLWVALEGGSTERICPVLWRILIVVNSD